MRILVLGGAGYIGSHTVYELVDAGYEVIVVDNLLTGFKEAVHPQAKFYEGDIRDKIFLDNILSKEKIDGVIHFAASSQVGESMKNPLKYYNNNLCGTEVLLESMVEHGIDKIVFSSTAATYGEPESIPILETDRTLPTNCYGETKLSMEKMFKWTANAHDLRFVSLRYFNACGAHPNGKIGIYSCLFSLVFNKDGFKYFANAILLPINDIFSNLLDNNFSFVSSFFISFKAAICFKYSNTFTDCF